MGCELCPRACGADRKNGSAGFCGFDDRPVVALADLHFWEEPCIAPPGSGSGAVFFAGCALRCVYCQNRAISFPSGVIPETWERVTPDRLRDIFAGLVDRGAANIDLVTADHFIPAVAEALDPKPPVPVVFNCSGYELPETLRLLEGKVDIYMPDMKYSLPGPAFRYSRAKDYPVVAEAAVAEMFRQVGPYQLDADGQMTRGLLVRHLILPGNVRNSLGVIDWFAKNYADRALFSLMAQYTPTCSDPVYPELGRRVTREEYDAVCDYTIYNGIENGFVQELDSADESFSPNFG